jgi:hypothetical protein
MDGAKTNRFKDGMYREDQTHTAMAKQLVYPAMATASLNGKLRPRATPISKKCNNRY